MRRPAIDPMLRSAAVCCGSRTIGAVLTGTLGDGASGLWAIGQAGGITVVQDPKDAAFAEMPLTALNRAKPDHVVRLQEMPALLAHLANQPAEKAKPLPRSVEFEVEIARNGRSVMDEMNAIGRRSVLACPDCGGVMWEIDEGDLSRFRCHVGHTYTAELMSLALDENLQRALASALRALEERVALADKLHDQAKASGHRVLAETWAEKAREFEREMDIIRSSTRRMDRLASEVNAFKPNARSSRTFLSSKSKPMRAADLPTDTIKNVFGKMTGQLNPPNVRFGSEAKISCPLCAKSGHWSIQSHRRAMARSMPDAGPHGVLELLSHSSN